MSTKWSVESDAIGTAQVSEIGLTHVEATGIPSSSSLRTSTASSTVVVVSSSTTEGSIQIRTIPEAGRRKSEDSTY